MVAHLLEVNVLIGVALTSVLQPLLIVLDLTTYIVTDTRFVEVTISTITAKWDTIRHLPRAVAFAIKIPTIRSTAHTVVSIGISSTSVF